MIFEVAFKLMKFRAQLAVTTEPEEGDSVDPDNMISLGFASEIVAPVDDNEDPDYDMSA